MIAAGVSAGVLLSRLGRRRVDKLARMAGDDVLLLHVGCRRPATGALILANLGGGALALVATLAGARSL